MLHSCKLLFHNANLFAGYVKRTVSALAPCFGSQTIFEAGSSFLEKNFTHATSSEIIYNASHVLLHTKENKSCSELNESLHKLRQPLKVHPRVHIKQWRSVNLDVCFKLSEVITAGNLRK